MPNRSAILFTTAIIAAYLSIANEPSAYADENIRFDVSDVSYLWPVPKTQADVDALISADASDGATKVALWDETAFNRMLDIVTSDAAAITHPSGKTRRIALLPAFRDRKTWKVVAFRADPSAPGGHPAIVAEFGSSPQLRLILQPVTVEDGKVKVHDFAAHLVYAYATPKEITMLGFLPPEKPDMPKFGEILNGLTTLKAKLKAKGVDTQGVLLGVHPGLKDNAGRADFVSDIRTVLNRHVNVKNLFAMAFMGLADSSPEPWIFVAAQHNGDGTFAPAKVPALNFKAAQMFDIIDRNPNIVPTPLPTNRNRITNFVLTPLPLRRGVATQALFDDKVKLDAIAIVNVTGDAIVDPEGLKNKDIADLIANPEKSHFFSNDCFSCHSESTRRSILKLPPSPAVAYTRPDGISGVEPAALPSQVWNVRNFGWFPDFFNGGATSPTVSQRTANETADCVRFINTVYFHNVVDRAAGRGAFVATTDPFNETVTTVDYLDQNWVPEESVKFYFTPQGSQLIPYDWFLALEQPMAQMLLRDNQNMLRYRFLAQNAGPLNPDGLPVGFVGGQGVSRKWLGLTCAACHTNEIHFGNVGYRIDGAPTQADVPGFLFDLVSALKQTGEDPEKFNRFARKVLGTASSQENRDELKAQIALMVKIRGGYNERNFPDYDPARAAPATLTNYGRLDAVDAIVNEVYWAASKVQDLDNPKVVAHPADAPVSYPFLWDAPQHDLVEWLGIAKGGGPGDIFSLSRNVGEVLGVFGDFVIPEKTTLLNLGYTSSVKFRELMALEDQLKTLWSPLWPEAFPKINQDDIAKGAQLYRKKLEQNQSCMDCHNLIDRTSPNRTVKAVITATDTDRRAFDNFFTSTRPSGRLAGSRANFTIFSAKIQAQADADTMLTNVVAGVILGGHRDAPPDQLDQLNFRSRAMLAMARPGLPGAKYKARPLNGIWATAPYLHNGSVPNLDALLRPVKDRPTSFSIGTRTFDPEKVGYVIDAPGFPKYEVIDQKNNPVIGHSNVGHEFGTSLNDDERRQLIAYLKTL